MSAPRDDDIGLLQAYVDGELDPMNRAALERRLAADPRLKAEHDNLLRLRALLHGLRDDDVPRERLRRRIDGALAAASADDTRPAWHSSWRAMAASMLIGAVLAGVATWGITLTTMRAGPGRDSARFVVASHVRALLAPQPFDVASSDRHTIKPWFAGRLPESPHVVDLTQEGFALVGGRVDVIDAILAATIVYRHDQHVVSLTVLRGQRPVHDGSFGGYRVRAWSEGDFTYVAVSDLPDIDLAHFQRAFVAGLAQL
jgi:anti-sigma factor RsiW